ncbi:ATP-binding protein [bacterium]|nr:ATP-binding protein [bacterium]
MNNVQSVGINPNAVSLNIPKTVNFRAQTVSRAENDPVDTFIKEQEKAKKKAKRQQIFSNTVLAAIGLGGLASVALLARSSGILKKAYKVPFKDINAEKSLNDLALPQAQKDAAARITTRIENYEEMVKKGGKKGSAILFYGPPGTGKNTFAYGIAKKFPNAKFVDMDISKMNSKWYGESEQNVLGTMEAIIKYAENNPKEKIFVFIDEIDSVMMQDRGSGSKISNDVLNAFKKGFNQLTNRENIIVMGATNLKIDPALARAEGKMLDTAMLDRFAQKVLVDLPTKDQLLEGIKKFYNSSDRGMIDDAVKNINDARWDKIVTFLADKERATSFRKLNDILGSAAESTAVGKNVTFEDIINAIKQNQQNLNVSDAEMAVFLNSIK